MNVPVPRNRLVALTIVGVLVTGLASVTLAAPNLLPGDDSRTAGPDRSDALASDAPTPNGSFTPAVQSQGGDDRGEHEYGEEGDDDHEYGEEGDDDHEYGEEGDRDEHEADDDDHEYGEDDDRDEDDDDE